MSDYDRILADIEKRLARLERAAEREPVALGPPMTLTQQLEQSAAMYTASKRQFCKCGRDICRAPDCPSHKADPLGR